MNSNARARHGTAPARALSMTVWNGFGSVLLAIAGLALGAPGAATAAGSDPPCTIYMRDGNDTWGGPSSQSWTDTGVWSLTSYEQTPNGPTPAGRVPNSTDYVCDAGDVAFGATQATLSGNSATIAGFFLAALHLSGNASLSVTGNGKTSEITTTPYGTDGLVLGAGATLTMGAGTGFVMANVVKADGSGAKIVNHGTWSPGGALCLDDGATFENHGAMGIQGMEIEGSGHDGQGPCDPTWPNTSTGKIDNATDGTIDNSTTIPEVRTGNVLAPPGNASIDDLIVGDTGTIHANAPGFAITFGSDQLTIAAGRTVTADPGAAISIVALGNGLTPSLNFGDNVTLSGTFHESGPAVWTPVDAGGDTIHVDALADGAFGPHSTVEVSNGSTLGLRSATGPGTTVHIPSAAKVQLGNGAFTSVIDHGAVLDASGAIELPALSGTACVASGGLIKNRKSLSLAEFSKIDDCVSDDMTPGEIQTLAGAKITGAGTISGLVLTTAGTITAANDKAMMLSPKSFTLAGTGLLSTGTGASSVWIDGAAAPAGTSLLYGDGARVLGNGVHAGLPFAPSAAGAVLDVGGVLVNGASVTPADTSVNVRAGGRLDLEPTADRVEFDGTLDNHGTAALSNVNGATVTNEPGATMSLSGCLESGATVDNHGHLTVNNIASVDDALAGVDCHPGATPGTIKNSAGAGIDGVGRIRGEHIDNAETLTAINNLIIEDSGGSALTLRGTGTLTSAAGKALSLDVISASGSWTYHDGA